MTKKPHKHADIIHAFADGATIQCYSPNTSSWYDIVPKNFFEENKYRIKPEHIAVNFYYENGVFQKCQDSSCPDKHELEVTYDDETDKIVDIKVCL